MSTNLFQNIPQATPPGDESKTVEVKADVKPPEKPVEKKEEPMSELAMLKQRADLMGITYSNNIGADTLAAKIKAHMERETQANTPAPKEEVKAQEEEKETTPVEQSNRPKTKQEMRRELHDEYMQLIRCRITCMDPKKADLKGEVLTVSNGILGTVRKFVPYGEACGEDGYHIPKFLYLFMKDRKFSQVKTDPKTGRPSAVDMPEYSIEILPQHTPKSLEKLRLKQAAASGTTEAD